MMIFLDSELDPIVCVPCTFFIGENGIPLEAVGGHVEPKQLIDKIDIVLQVSFLRELCCHYHFFLINYNIFSKRLQAGKLFFSMFAPQNVSIPKQCIAL